MHQNQIGKCNVVKPPKEFVAYINLEIKFVEEFDRNCYKISVGEILFTKFKYIRPFLCYEDYDQKIVIALFIRIKIYLVTKLLNKDSIPNLRNKNFCVFPTSRFYLPFLVVTKC